MPLRVFSLLSQFSRSEKRGQQKKKKKSKSFFSLSSPSGKVVQSQEIILAVLRLLRAAPYCPQGKEIGNPTAGIQSVRKSSRPCPQNISSIRWLTTTPSATTLDQATTASCLMISFASERVSSLPSTRHPPQLIQSRASATLLEHASDLASCAGDPRASSRLPALLHRPGQPSQTLIRLAPFTPPVPHSSVTFHGTLVPARLSKCTTLLTWLSCYYTLCCFSRLH